MAEGNGVKEILEFLNEEQDSSIDGIAKMSDEDEVDVKETLEFLNEEQESFEMNATDINEEDLVEDGLKGERIEVKEDESFLNCVLLQRDMNKRAIGENWEQGDTDGKIVDFNFASTAEAAEAILSLDYKWWKAPQETDVENIITELVDILHFDISDFLTISSETPVNERMCSTILGFAFSNTHLQLPLEAVDSLEPNSIKKIRMEAIKHVMYHITMPDHIRLKGDVTSYYVSRFTALFDAFKIFGIRNKEDIIKRYLIKNVLNVFRNKNGYKEGTYIKEWMDIGKGFAVEDNVMALKIADSLTVEPTFDLIYAGLEAYYNEYVAVEKEEK